MRFKLQVFDSKNTYIVRGFDAPSLATACRIATRKSRQSEFPVVLELPDGKWEHYEHGKKVMWIASAKNFVKGIKSISC